MRSIINLFRLKEYPEIEVIRVGNTKIILVKIPKVAELKALLKYAKVKDYLIFLVDKLSDIYMYSDEIFDLSLGFLIIYKNIF